MLYVVLYIMLYNRILYIYTYLLQDVVLYNPENKNNSNMLL